MPLAVVPRQADPLGPKQKSNYRRHILIFHYYDVKFGFYRDEAYRITEEHQYAGYHEALGQQPNIPLISYHSGEARILKDALVSDCVCGDTLVEAFQCEVSV